MAKVLLLNEAQMMQKVKRIAFEIYENNYEEKEIIIAGIAGMGYVMAQKLMVCLADICPLKLSLAEIGIDKSLNYQSEITIKSEVDTFKNKTVVLCDDVLHSGRTLAFSLRPFLSIPLKKLQVAVLVNRGHNVMPIAADYIGYQLSNTLTEHITVRFDSGNESGVFLF